MQGRLRFLWLFLQTFFGRHKKFIGLGVFVGFLITLTVSQFSPYMSRFFVRKERRIGIVGRYTDRNLPLSIQTELSLGLTSLTASGSAAPAIAESWEIGNNGKSYTFHLNPEIAWQDGKKFVSKDVQYNIKGANFTAVDDHTVKIDLMEPYAPLPVLLSHPLLRQDMVGVGSYRVLKADYSGDDELSGMTLQPVKTGLMPLVYKFYPSVDDAVLAFKLGDIDTLQDLPKKDSLIGWKNVKITEVTQYDRFVGVFFNLKNQIFRDKEIRQAMAYAVPKIDDYEKAFSPISPLSWAYSSKIKVYRYEPDDARKVLAKSQLASSSGQVTLSTYAGLLDTAQMLADSWSKAGANVKVKVENSVSPDYDMFLLTQFIPADPDQYQYWQSTQEGTNLTHYSNLKIDKLLEDGRKTVDTEQRKKIYADFLKYLVDDSPVIFLYHPKVYTIERIR